MILDHRQTLALALQLGAETPEDMDRVWAALAAGGTPPRVLVETKTKVTAYVNDGRWIADCPYCHAGVLCWPENPRAACLGCFRILRPLFPSVRERARAERLLVERPPVNRNWLRHRGETIAALQAENDEQADEIAAFGGLG